MGISGLTMLVGPCLVPYLLGDPGTVPTAGSKKLISLPVLSKLNTCGVVASYTTLIPSSDLHNDPRLTPS